MENALAPAATETAPTSARAPVWTGRVLTALIATFLLVDAVAKLVPLAPVVEATQKIGFAYETIRPIGAVLALSTVLHLIPRTQLVGAVLLSAYLGGATATNVHIGRPFWMPVVMGVLLWMAYGLRTPRLRGLLSLAAREPLPRPRDSVERRIVWPTRLPACETPAPSETSSDTSTEIPMPDTTLFISTRKGLWTLRSGDRTRWQLEGPQHLGHLVHHTVLDPRDEQTVLAGVRTGHLGPTVMRSLDGGKTWKEASQHPAFPKGEPRARAVDHVFWLTPGHASQPGVWYAGTSPQGLFRSDDAGDTWKPVSGYNDHPDQAKWAGGDKDQTPDGGKLHSILVDPRDAKHLYVGMSGGGFFESKDEGATWKPLSRGVDNKYLPKLPDGEEHTFGDDPHCVQLHPLHPDRLWNQNHFGIYRLDRDKGERWTRVGLAMPAEVGDIGFSVVLHPRDPDTVWVFPMDGTDVWPRTSPGGKPALYVTRDGGASWTRQDKGFPTEQAWWTVKRQAMAGDAGDPVGLYLGTTNGEVWASADGGESFACIARHLPHIYAVTVGTVGTVG